MNTYSDLFASQQAHFANVVRFTTVKERIRKLRSMLDWIARHQSDIEQALYHDFRKPAAEVVLGDIWPVVMEIKDAIAHLQTWMRPRAVSMPLPLSTASARIHYEPKGVSLILSPWNFPFNLAVGPLVSAVAAGNCVVLKPSELSSHTSDLLREMMESCFVREEVAVCLGDVQVATDLLQLPFDHIFFTGSPEVGKIVMHAAANHLSSVTLELGGRNPVVVDETVDVADAAEKLVWGKFINNGQSCVSPNYIMVDRRIQAELVAALKNAVGRLYDPDAAAVMQSPHYARVINDRHFVRIKNLIDDAVQRGARLVTGGVTRAEERFIAPTILDDVPLEAAIMGEEIFGPVLPIAAYDRLPDVISHINSAPRPLALYVFSTSQRTIDTVINRTNAGGTCVNETTVHFAHTGLPFGGVGHSGLGKSHGHAGFLAFTNERPVLVQRRGFTYIKLVYPPYTGWKKKLLHALTWWL